MGPSWANAFAVATAITLGGTPVLRRIALATDFVDHPVASHKSHETPTPYLGGIGLIVAVLIGLLFTHRVTPQVGVVALGGSFIGCLGLLDDHRSVGALFRFAVELGVAAIALAAGLRVHATDIPAIDGFITLIWIVGVTNAVNLLDNMDGLAAGVSAAAAAAIFLLAVLGEQYVTATIAAGLVGACLGFLMHNKRPASIFMGDTGSLFLGFVLAATTIGVDPALSPPASFAVPLMLLALPVLDTATVTLCRIRRGRSVALGGKDHLSHRLVARGLSPAGAVAVLVGAEATFGALAVLAGRDVLPLPVAILGAAALLAGVAAWTLPAPVYMEPVAGFPPRMKRLAMGGGAVLVVLAAPATLALARAHGPGVAGAVATREGLAAIAAGNAPEAIGLLDTGARELNRADHILGGRLNSLGLLLPGLRANLGTTRALVRSGKDAAGAASSLAALVAAPDMPLNAATDPARQAGQLAPALDRSASVLRRSAAQLTGYDRPYLWPSLGTMVRQARTQLVEASADATRAADLARLLPVLMGESGSRHYFLAVQDSAELRASGGVIHDWGELVADNGRMTLTTFGPIKELDGAGQARTLDAPPGFADRYSQFDVANTWENVNVSPDFGVTGRLITSLYPQSTGRHVDGVVAVDLSGLAALLKVAGPVQVDGWPAPVSSDNLTDVVLHGAPQRFPAATDLDAFRGSLFRRIIESFTNADLGTPARLATMLSASANGGHLLLYSSRPDEEQVVKSMGLAGQLPGPSGDSLLVVNQNLTGTETDANLQRSVRYDVTLDPGREPAVLTGSAQVTLRNGAPEAAAPAGAPAPLPTGDNRSYLSVYSPLALQSAQPDLDTATELGRFVHSTMVTVPPQQARTVTVALDGRIALAPGHRYQLDVLHQTSLQPDEVEISLTVPSGWRIAEAQGLQVIDARHARASLLASDPQQFSVRLERTAWSRLWARIPG